MSSWKAATSGQSFSRKRLSNFISMPPRRCGCNGGSAEGQRDEIAARDRADSSRAASPLVVAPDAAVIDTSSLTIDGVVDRIIQQLVRKGLPIHAQTATARPQRMNPYYWLGYTLSRLLAQVFFDFASGIANACSKADR